MPEMYRLLVLAFALAPLTRIAQIVPQDSVPPADPVIRVSVNLAQIAAVVTDAKGTHIADLSPEDFEVLEDGKPRTIRNFSYIDLTPKDPAPPPSRKPRANEIRRTLAVVVDDINTSTEDLMHLRLVVKKFVAEQVRPGDLVSLSAASGGLGFYQQFTGESHLLDAAADALPFARSATRVPSNLLVYCRQAKSSFEVVMGQLTWEIETMRALPGRKSLVLLSDGLDIRTDCGDEAPLMRQSMRKVADLANRAGVVIYTFDARGLTVRPSGLQAETSAFLADETGGVFFHDTNGLSQALNDAINDMNGYYLIAWSPGAGDSELRGGQPQYHKIEVKLKRRGLTVRSGKGFYDSVDQKPEASAGNERQLTTALLSLRSSSARRRASARASGDICARSSLNFVVFGIVFVLHLGKVVVLHAEFTHRGMARSVYASLPVNITARYFYPGCTPRTGSGGSPQRSRRRRSKL